MTPREARHPAVPSFESGFLDALAAALARRARALKYQASGLACSRAVTPHGEVLHLDIDVGRTRATRIRVMVWSDGMVRLGVHQPAPYRVGGWAISLERHGDIRHLSPADVVEKVEQTLEAVHGDTRSHDAGHRVDTIWASEGFGREA